MSGGSRKARSGGAPEAEGYARAILNILEDSDSERARLNDAQRAVLNILEDSAGEKARLEMTQQAVLNILDDSAEEKERLGGTQRAILNILEDSAGEKTRLEVTQKAVLNILDDFDIEKKKADQVNLKLRGEIAERARAEEALRRANAATEAANRELEAFSYSVAHDLRAPLRGVDGFSQAILEDCADRLGVDGMKYLRNVRESAQQMGKLIDDLLNLSRVSRSELRRESVDLSLLARSVLARLRGTEPARRVESAVEDGLVAQADPRLLEIVLTNLLGNAWKFTGKHPVARIGFGAKTGESPPVYFVRDDGAGFDEAYAGKLFGVFQRLHASHEFEGTGIGLAIVQRIVSRHGGRIWAEGAVGRGAAFYFTLEEARP